MEKNKKTLKIDTRAVGEDAPVFIIAEAGINHNGDIAIAKKLVDAAAAAGADAVKFQMRNLDELYASGARKEEAEDIGTEYLIRLIKNADLPPEAFSEIAAYARGKGIIFLCTPWDKKSADYLEKLGVPAYKIASGDLTNFDLLEHVAAKKKPLLISTGMATLEEIKKTIGFLKKEKAEFTLLHCNSAYPAHPKDLNLRFLPELQKISGRFVGYSGHELGAAATLAAAALGAKVIERHITLDRAMVGPDHAVSLLPEEFRQLVRDIRVVSAALGTNKKYVTSGEAINRKNLGKSLAAAKSIKKGRVITRDMVTARSPAKGLSPQSLYELIGRKARRDFAANDFFNSEDLGKSKRILKRLPKGRFGIIARPHDLAELVSGITPEIIELHLSSRDIERLEKEMKFSRYPKSELVVHLPELYGSDLLDLCSLDETARRKSVANAERGLNIVPKIRQFFGGTPEKIKVIIHVGGMSREGFVSAAKRAKMYERLAKSLAELHYENVDLLLENLPPFPWYRGGQWYSNTFLDADEIAAFAKKNGLGLCYDSSHAELFCHYAKKDPVQFFKTLAPYVRHIHLSDAAGLDGEGLQIDEGEVPWRKLLPLVKKSKIGFTPEIWMGHREGGEGFRTALSRLASYGI